MIPQGESYSKLPQSNDTMPSPFFLIGHQLVGNAKAEEESYYRVCENSNDISSQEKQLKMFTLKNRKFQNCQITSYFNVLDCQMCDYNSLAGTFPIKEIIFVRCGITLNLTQQRSFKKSLDVWLGMGGGKKSER